LRLKKGEYCKNTEAEPKIHYSYKKKRVCLKVKPQVGEIGKL